jgi:hypothetical protein
MRGVMMINSLLATSVSLAAQTADVEFHRVIKNHTGEYCKSRASSPKSTPATASLFTSGCADSLGTGGRRWMNQYELLAVYRQKNWRALLMTMTK